MNETTTWSTGQTQPLKVLVAYASRHGGTAGIAQALAAELEFALGSSAACIRCLPAADVSSVASSDAVVLGSALYYGRWLPEARKFLERFESDLVDRDVWLFSSGPLERSNPAASAKHPDVVSTRIGAREHKVFPGRLNLDDLNRVERTVARLVHGQTGDFRDFPEIRRWARHIADHICTQSAQSA